MALEIIQSNYQTNATDIPTNKLAQTVALIQNSINETEKKLMKANENFVNATFNNDAIEVHKAAIEIAGLKSTIQAYKDCSSLMLDTLQ